MLALPASTISSSLSSPPPPPVPLPVVVLLTDNSLIVLSAAFFCPFAVVVVGADGDVFTTVALAARRGREVDGVPGTDGAMGARFEVGGAATADVRGAGGRVAAGVPGAEGAVEFRRRPLDD